MHDVRVAGAQIRCRLGDLEANLRKHRELAQQAADAGAKIICFPELSLCGYPVSGDLPHELARGLDGEPAAAIAELADELDLTILAGMLERSASGVVHNTQLVAMPGRRLEAYRKTHVPTSEIGRFRAGDRLPVFHASGAAFGVQICYDTHFPEVAAVQAEAGAEILFMPHASAGGETREQKRTRWLRYLPARAYDNAVFGLVVNHADPERGFPPLTMAFDPWGEVIGEARPDGEDLLVVDFRAAALGQRRAVAETFFAHFRRPELYRPRT